MKLLEYASKFDYEYAFLISGDDVPVVANKDVNQFLQQNYGRNLSTIKMKEIILLIR
nr:hypothetical protein [Klebsiella pneumoniae]